MNFLKRFVRQVGETNLMNCHVIPPKSLNFIISKIGERINIWDEALGGNDYQRKQVESKKQVGGCLWL